MMYPKDIELQKIAQDYKRARIYGSIFLDELEARDSQEIYKKTKNCVPIAKVATEGDEKRNGNSGRSE